MTDHAVSQIRLCLKIIIYYQGIGVITGEDENVDGRGVVGHTDALKKQTKMNYFEGGLVSGNRGVSKSCSSH
jgi:hypothetical protein